MEFEKNELVSAYAQNIGSPAARQLISKNIEIVGLPDKERYTGDEALIICKALADYDGLVRMIAQTLSIRIVEGMQKETEDAWFGSQERLMALLENIPDIVYFKDLEGVNFIVNNAYERFVGMERDSIIGKTDCELLPPDMVEADRRSDEAVIAAGKPVRVELRTERNCEGKGKGEMRFFEADKKPLYDAEKRIVGIVGVIREITERKLAEREREAMLRDLEKMNRKLEISNRELQDFAYVASHDLKEPMRKITYAGTLLQESLEGRLNEDQQENFEFMIDGARRMQQMLDALLIFSRVTTKAKPFEPVDLNEVIEDLISVELAVRIEETGGVVRVPESLPMIQADPAQTHQLLQNLIGNALKYCQEGTPPEITVRASEEGDMVRTEVLDNGIGIDGEDRDNIFIMFKRLHSRDAYGGGSGIGLAVCKKIVERHGGTIGIDSRSGEGSTFWFTAPTASYGYEK